MTMPTAVSRMPPDFKVAEENFFWFNEPISLPVPAFHQERNMPTTIPYDPTLAIGQLVSESTMQRMHEISAIQAPADAAEDTLNSLRTIARSIDLTIQELRDMGIEAPDLVKQREELEAQARSAAAEYARVRAASQDRLQGLAAPAPEHRESPVDYGRSHLQQMPLTSDSLQFNVQYFPYDKDEQQMAAVASFVADHVNAFGDEVKRQASAAVVSGIANQSAPGDIAGTFIIGVSCMHKNAALLAPLVLDIDKAIRIWNQTYPDDAIETDQPQDLVEIAAKSGTDAEKSLHLVSGATHGSFFIGMVHVLASSANRDSRAMHSLAADLQRPFETGGWFAHVAGDPGADLSYTSYARECLQSREVDSRSTRIATRDDLIDTSVEDTPDTNAMLGALDDYLQQALQGKTEVPVSYYLKPFPQSELVQLWAAKHHPASRAR